MACEPPVGLTGAMPTSAVQPIPLPPIEVAPETFLLRCAQPAFGAPLSVSLNSLVIRAAEPVIVDTGPPSDRDHWLETVFALVDPADVRWVVLSHDDADHTGNLAEVLAMCPDATLVTNWSATERMGCEIAVDPQRLRWVDDGGSIDVGDRTLRALRPPVYDSPCTRAFSDSSTGVLWASDMFATPMPDEPVDRVEDIPEPMWVEGMAMFHHHALAPWLAVVDRGAYAADVERLRRLAPSVIVGAHTPLIAGASVAAAIDRLAALPDIVPPPHPDQHMLDAALAGVGTASTSGGE
jgi:flavorubredoxin